MTRECRSLFRHIQRRYHCSVALVMILNRQSASWVEVLQRISWMIARELYRMRKKGLELLDGNAGHYILIGTSNSAWFLTRLGRRNEARGKVAEAQDILSGLKKVERPKLILRWIKSLLLEDTGGKNERKIAGQMLDRVEVSMQSHGMDRERRVLLADRARIARAPYTIKQIARKALALETSRRVRICIEAVLSNPTRDNICKWRDSLDSYVPPFTDSLR